MDAKNTKKKNKTKTCRIRIFARILRSKLSKVGGKSHLERKELDQFRVRGHTLFSKTDAQLSESPQPVCYVTQPALIRRLLLLQLPLHIELGSAASTIPLAKWIGLIIKNYFRANQISSDLSLLGVRGAAVAYKHLSIYKARARGSF